MFPARRALQRWLLQLLRLPCPLHSLKTQQLEAVDSQELTPWLLSGKLLNLQP